MANTVNLNFTVTKQAITRTDAEVVASGAINTLVANFDFCETWDGLTRFCRFEGAAGVVDVAIDDDDKCVIPWEVIEAPSFTMACYGTLSTDVQLTTTKLTVRVYQSVNFITDEPLPSTPKLIDLYSKLAQHDLSDLAFNSDVEEIADDLEDEASARSAGDANEAAARAEGDTALGARIDNIIANGQSTSGNTELIDIRTGYDGTVYTTAGAAVRGQIEQALDFCEQSLELLSIGGNEYLNENNVFTLADTAISASDGALVQSSDYAASPFISVRSGDKLNYRMISSNPMRALIAVYTKSGVFAEALVSGGTDVGSTGIHAGSIEFDSDCLVRVSTTSISGAFVSFGRGFTPEEAATAAGNLAANGLIPLDASFMRCSTAFNNFAGAHRATNVEPLSFSAKTEIVALDGYSFWIIYVNDSDVSTGGGSGAWVTSFAVPANQLFHILIRRTVETTSDIADIPRFVANVGVKSAKLMVDELDGFVSLSRIGCGHAKGWLNNNAAIMPSLLTSRMLLGYVRVHVGDIVRVVEGDSAFNGFQLMQFNENGEFVGNIGTLTSKDDKVVTVNGFIRVYSDWGVDDADTIVSEIMERVQVKFGVQATSYKPMPLEWVIGQLVNGEPSGASNTRIYSGKLAVGKGTKVLLKNVTNAYIIEKFDLVSKKLIGQVDGTLVANSYSYNPCVVIDEDCYIRVYAKKQTDGSFTEAERALMNDVVLFDTVAIPADIYDAVPSYYFAPVSASDATPYLEKKVSEINAFDDACGYNGDMFAFITDTHWKTNYGRSPLLMKYVLDNTNVSRMVFGGDATTNDDTKDACKAAFHEWRNLYPVDGDKYFAAIGNHEYNNPGATSERLPITLTANEAYRMAVSESASYMTVYEQNVQAWDNQSAKIRYVFIGCVYNSRISNETVEAFETALSETPSGYSCIVISHVGLTSAGVLDSEFSAILNAIVSAKNDGLDFIGVICGHNHADKMLTTNGVTIVSTTCDTNNENGGLTRTMGTISENAFDVVCIDKANRTVNLVRIGAGSNRQFDY